MQVQANVPGAQAPGDPYFHLGMTNTGTVCSIGGCLVQGTMHDMYYQLPPGGQVLVPGATLCMLVSGCQAV